VYWDGGSKQFMVKRFLIETTTPDKDFNFISESIGSRLEFVTTKEEPEVLADVVKGKDKSTETISLEEIIDVKGWKAMGNRLSQFKVTKVRPAEEPEDSGLEEGDEENELVDGKTTETGKGSPSSKKKMGVGSRAGADSRRGRTSKPLPGAKARGTKGASHQRQSPSRQSPKKANRGASKPLRSKRKK